MSKTTQTVINHQAAWTDESTDTDPAWTPDPNRSGDGGGDEPAGDPTAAYCEGCGNYLPYDTPDISRTIGNNEGHILACARSDCEGVKSRAVGTDWSTHTQAALTARQRAHGSRTGAGVGR